MNITRALFRLRIWKQNAGIQSALSILIIATLTLADGKPTRLLPRHALEKFYHAMLRTTSTVDSELKHTPSQGTGINQEQFRRFYKSQYSTLSTQPRGITTRVLIYSVASKGYLTVSARAVSGKGSRFSKFAVVNIESIGFGKVRLRGEASKNYVCFDDKGKLTGKPSGDDKNCMFRQFALANHYTAFQSCTENPLVVGIRPKGTVKKGARTKIGQKAAKFIIVRL
ncbi:fibroblast growth factor 17-like [Rhopilema esculentum]|uniref:fibroblast growth factor 17-like n=1 Tax=Rhopilema esculentum TaxID=499914 RepID=UPI0031CEB683